jgi:two-component system, OmpR family, sensor histidine kinase KdpD
VVRPRVRGIYALVIGASLPLLATMLAASPIEVSTATAALAYVLAVTAAATLGGLWAGLASSVISFLGLNFFFTRPYHTFVVTKPEDLIALIVFLLVSATIGTLISTAVAQRVRAENREREAHDARQDAETNRTRAALFSSVTHDLRTPLASITASVTGLQSAEANLSAEDRRELLGTIRQEAERLNRMVGNLLDLSRMRAGSFEPSMSTAGIDEVVASVVGRLDPLIRNHDIVVDLPDDLPDVRMDVVQIDQVLTNLIENAARFAPNGTAIAVEASALDHLVQLRVKDHGPGIASQEREKVFEPFVRGAGSPGTGLGLAISRAVVDGHHGRIWIESTTPHGTTIVVELPVGD